MKIEESKYEPNARMDAESSHSSERAQKEKVSIKCIKILIFIGRFKFL